MAQFDNIFARFNIDTVWDHKWHVCGGILSSYKDSDIGRTGKWNVSITHTFCIMYE